ncbi:hypothetical protein N431DRAFT_355863 [Stipitochalara longipes BDJ]|nr:hypothetical protein N431DRAFT_355863 [Stipitochalara longipes BDJ]
MSQLVARLSTDYDQNGNPYPNKRGSLIIIFPVGCLLNAANARKRSRVPEPSHPVSEVSDNEDRTKRRRLDSEGYSAIPRTVKASARIANLDSPTKESGSSEGTCPVPAGSMRSARYVDAATDSPSSTTAEPLDGLGAPAKPNFGIALGNYRISQISEEVAASKAEQEALNTEFGHNKHHISDSEIESRTEADRELESQINASASSGVSNLTLAEKQASLSGLLSLLEKRTDTQRQNFTAAHQLQVSTSEEVSLLRTASNRYGQEIEAIKHSAKREKEWRRYFDKSTKEDRSKFARLEAKVSREREDKQNFKMSMEGRVDAMIKHHQISSDAVMKKMAALEKLVTEQSKQLEEQSKLIEVLTKHGAANRNEVTQIPRIEPKPTEEKERITLSNGGNKPPLRPAWARAK